MSGYQVGARLVPGTGTWPVVPRGRFGDPAAAEHGRDDLHLLELAGLAGDRVAVEDDEVGEEARHEPAAPALVAREPRGRHGGRMQRLLDVERLLRAPRLA